MLIFAHLRKCAGTSVIEAAIEAGVRLPPRHRNGHPTGDDGHAIPGLSRMAPEAVAAILTPLASAGVQLTAIEWDFPPFASFPDDLGLRFFTILRDPVERFLSNYAYDVVSGFTASRTVMDYLGEGGIWTQGNYYTRFFAGLGPHEAVGPGDVEAVLDILLQRFHYTFTTDDIGRFLSEEVGLSVGRLRQANRVSWLRRLFHRMSLDVSGEAIEAIEAANSLDRRLYASLQRARAANGLRSRRRTAVDHRTADHAALPCHDASSTHPFKPPLVESRAIVRSREAMANVLARLSGRNEIMLRGLILERERTVREREATIRALEEEVRSLQERMRER